MLACGTALAVSALLATGCGSSGSDTSTASGGETHKATGSPVKVMTILDASKAKNITQDYLVAGNEAAVRTINDTLNGLGGSGHPIEVEICETDLDPNKAAACARKAADDPSYVAVVGGLALETEVVTTLEAAQVPLIPGCPAAPGEYTSPIVFNTNGCQVISPIAQADMAASAGAKAVALMTNGLAGTEVAEANYANTMKSHGLPTPKEVVVPLTATDISPYVAEAANGTGAVIVALAPPAQTNQTLTSRLNQGLDTPFIIFGLNITPTSLETMGAAGDGVMLPAWYPPPTSSAPGEKRYLDSMKAAGHEDSVGDYSQSGWVAFDLLNYATRGMQTFDRASVLKALNSVSDYTGDGLTPPLDFSKPAPNPDYPRIYNWSYFPGKIENGAVVPVGDKQPVMVDPSIAASPK